MPTKKADTKPPVPTGQLIDAMFSLREDKRALEAKVKDIETQYTELEEQLIARLGTEGIDKATGKKASVSVTKNIVANVVDWERLCAYVKRTGNFQLFQRRVSDPAYRELMGHKGGDVPGLTPFEKTRLNLRVVGGE